MMCVKPEPTVAAKITGMHRSILNQLTWPVSQHTGLARVALLRLALAVAALTGLAWLVFRLWLAQLTLG